MEAPKLSGIHRGSSYLGVEAINPPDFVVHDFSPTIDNSNFNVGTFWLNFINKNIYVLVKKDLFSAVPALWKRLGIFSNGLDGQVLIGGGVDPVWNYITSPLNTLSFGYGANTLSMDVSGSIANRYDTDVGFAVPLVNVLQVIGGTNINTAGAGNIVTVHLDDSVLLAGSLTAGTGIVVTAGGIESTGQTQLHDLSRGVVQSSATGVLSSNEGTDGQLLISSSAGAPLWNNITSSDGSVTVTNGNNSIDLVVVSYPKLAGFFAKDTTGELTVSGDGTVYVVSSACNLVDFDYRGDFNPATGIFTCSLAGYYFINFNTEYGSVVGGANYVYVNLVTTSTTIAGTTLPTRNQIVAFYGPNVTIAYEVSYLIYMNVGDTAYVTITGVGGAKLDKIQAPLLPGYVTYFEAELLFE